MDSYSVGSRAPEVSFLSASPTLAINMKSKDLKAAGHDIYKFGFGQSPFPVPDIIQEALRDNVHQKAYEPTQGLPALREQIAQYVRASPGVADYDASHIMIGPGTKELMFTLQLCHTGQLLLPNPSWVSYLPQGRILGRDVHYLETRAGDLKLQPETLDKFCVEDGVKSRILVLNYPNNPSGSTFTETELKELADVARSHKILVLSDEIYADVTYSGKHVSISKFYPEGTIVSNGLSKWCGAGGWRLGFMALPAGMEWLRDSMGFVGSELYSCVSSPIQYAAITAYTPHSEIDDYLELSRWALKALASHTVEQLRVAGASVREPQGGFYVMPDFSDTPRAHAFRQTHAYLPGNAEGFFDNMLERTGVAMLPGSHFGRPEHELSARLAFVDFDGAKVLEGARSMRNIDAKDTKATLEFANKYCARTMQGLQVLSDALQATNLDKQISFAPERAYSYQSTHRPSSTHHVGRVIRSFSSLARKIR